MSESIVDVVIVGSGPAGIQAAIHAARKKTRVLMLGRIENSALYGAHIENYACIAGVTSGKDLLEVGLSQVEHFGAEILPEDILKISQQEQLFELELESGRQVICRSIIFSMGSATALTAMQTFTGEPQLLLRATEAQPSMVP